MAPHGMVATSQPLAAQAAFYTFISGTLMLAPSWFMFEVYGRVLNSRNPTTLWWLVGMVLGVYVVLELLEQQLVEWPGTLLLVSHDRRFLDNVIEQNNYPLPEIDKMSRGNRRIGLGVMGFADVLIKLGITYDSDEGLAFAEKVMKFVDDEAWEESRNLAEERGVKMPSFFGYMLWSGAVLVPVFALATFVFFR